MYIIVLQWSQYETVYMYTWFMRMFRIGSYLDTRTHIATMQMQGTFFARIEVFLYSCTALCDRTLCEYIHIYTLV